MVFGRRKRAAQNPPADPAADVETGEEIPAGETAVEEASDEESADPGESAQPEAPIDRSEGPYDIAEVAQRDAMAGQRIDLGAVQVPLLDGLEIRVEIDQESQAPAAITLIRGQGAVQVRAFAAPFSGGGWSQARTEIRRSVSGDGGTIDEVSGAFGLELLAAVVGQDEQGNRVRQQIRFIGVDGPRWLLQGVMMGEGTIPDRAGLLEEVFRSLVVVRGETAMPPGTALAITLPEQVPGEVTEIDDEEIEEITDFDDEDPADPR